MDTQISGTYCKECEQFLPDFSVDEMPECENCNSKDIHDCIVVLKGDINYNLVGGR
jgi:methionyl-tRNA synthetase